MGDFALTCNAAVFLGKTQQTALLRVKLHTWKMLRGFTIVARFTFTDPAQILFYCPYVRLFVFQISVQSIFYGKKPRVIVIRTTQRIY